MEKQRTLYQQARLHDRGAAEMVLQMISASKGNVQRTEVHTVNFILYNAIHTHMHNDEIHISYTTFYAYDIFIISDSYMIHNAAKV